MNLTAALIGMLGLAGVGGGYAPDVHKPLPTDDSRNLSAAAAKREWKWRKRIEIEARNAGPKPMKIRGVYLPTKNGDK